MGTIKTIEHIGKRALVSLLTRVVRTRPASRQAVFAVPPERILVIRQHNQMGDMLLAVPALRAIKETFPGVHLALLTSRINREVMLNHPHVDRVLTFDARRPLRAPWLVATMRRQRYDVVIVLHTVSFSVTSALLGLLCGARFRLGSSSEDFGNRMSRSFYHLELPLPSPRELAAMNESEHNLYPLRALGITTDDLSPVMAPSATETDWARRFVADHAAPGAIKLVVHPGAGKVENIWPPVRFAEVVDLLSRESRLAVFVVEGPRDAESVAAFCSAFGAPRTVIRGSSIGQVAALMRECDLVLCNDTGVMHVSSAVGARTLAVFGPTDPMRWAPRCRNLHVVRKENGSLEALQPIEVFAKAAHVLGLPAVKSVERA